jgi:transposase
LFLQASFDCIGGTKNFWSASAGLLGEELDAGDPARIRRRNEWMKLRSMTARRSTLQICSMRPAAATRNWINPSHQPSFCTLVRARSFTHLAPGEDRKTPIPHDAEMYEWRHVVENYIRRLKEWRRITTRYDKTEASSCAFIHLSAAPWEPSHECLQTLPATTGQQQTRRAPLKNPACRPSASA